ncbi:hypothetical protein [Pedobacter sp. KBW01]|uniref:hypothetical protein n=1 Tax=Pedobacter sp. KBW01 TaxID=2153364 RepID=UPI000F595DF5|nr:hypothetical protein [Pedobacter sp. KBW01]
MNRCLKYSINLLPLVMLLCSSIASYSQSRTQIAAQLSKLINNSTYSDELQYYNNTIDANCNTLTHSFDTFQSVTFTRTEKFARVSSTYRNIPWKNLQSITHEKISTSAVYLFFAEPIVQSRKLTYGNYFKNKYTDGTTERSVRSIQLHIKNTDLLVFETLCYKLKLADSAQNLQAVAPIKTLPQTLFSQKVLPPSKNEAQGIIFDSTTGYKCGPQEWPSYWCKFFKLGAIDISNMGSDEMKAKSLEMQAYWNKYCYSFTTGDWRGITGGSITTLLDINNDTGSSDAFGLIAYRVKGNVNFLNPFNGKNYFDNLYASYGKKEHYVEYEKEEVQREWEYLQSRAKRWGTKSSAYMLQQYKYNAQAHQELIEAILCNTQGEGVFAGLKSNPAQYLLQVYNVGIRNFEEAVFLFESSFKTQISSADKTAFRQNLKYQQVLWD